MSILERHKEHEITEVDRVVLALYLVEKGWPPTTSGWESEAHVLSVLFQWPEEKAELLLSQAVTAGYAERA